MLRTRILATLMPFALVACSDAPPPTGFVLPTIPPIIQPPSSNSVQLTGTVTTEAPPADNAVYLQLDDQSRIIIVGSQVIGLGSVTGATVLVEGSWSDGYAMGDTYVLDVRRFEVLSVGGRAAIDGFLQETEDGFALRLQNGEMYVLTDPSAALLEHLGQRVWITPAEEGEAETFGVIAS